MARPCCSSCRRPLSVCVCALVHVQNNALPVVVLQHPDESSHPLNTAVLACRGLTHAKLLNGLDFSRESLRADVPDSWLTNPFLLYPTQETSAELVAAAPATVMLVLDGTWRNTREILLRNPWLQSLPRMDIPAGESRYRLRKSQVEGGLATIEAIARGLHRQCESFDVDALLRPFHAMIQQQIDRMGQKTYNKNYKPP